MTYVFVIDQFHELEFPVGPLGMGHILEGPTQFLYGYILLSHTVIRSTGKEHQKEEDEWISLFAVLPSIVVGGSQLNCFTLCMNGTLFVIVDVYIEPCGSIYHRRAFQINTDLPNGTFFSQWIFSDAKETDLYNSWRGV